MINEKEEIFNNLLSLKEHNENLEEQNKMLIKKMNKMEKLISQSKSSSNSLVDHSVNDNSTHINNNNQHNFMLTNYGQEDLTKIDKKLFIKAAKKGFVAHSHPDIQILCASKFLLFS